MIKDSENIHEQTADAGHVVADESLPSLLRDVDIDQTDFSEKLKYGDRVEKAILAMDPASLSKAGGQSSLEIVRSLALEYKSMYSDAAERCEQAVDARHTAETEAAVLKAKLVSAIEVNFLQTAFLSVGTFLLGAAMTYHSAGNWEVATPLTIAGFLLVAAWFFWFKVIRATSLDKRSYG